MKEEGNAHRETLGLQIFNFFADKKIDAIRTKRMKQQGQEEWQMWFMLQVWQGPKEGHGTDMKGSERIDWRTLDEVRKFIEMLRI